VDALEAEVRAQSRQIDFDRASTLLRDGMNTYLNRMALSSVTYSLD